MSNNIGYHTRRQDGTKQAGGSFGGGIDMETVNRLVNCHFCVAVTPSGRAVFIDRFGSEVSLYLTVDASATDIGRLALSQWRISAEKQRRLDEALEQERQQEIDQLMEGLTHEEIVKRLRGAA